MLIRCVEQKSDGKSMKMHKDWTAIENMSAAMPLAVIASRIRILRNTGFDLGAIRKAQAYNDRHKEKGWKGTSTISQQTAKNVFLWPSRSWIRKGFEVYFTFWLSFSG